MIKSSGFLVRRLAIAVASLQHWLVFGSFCACSGICLSLVFAFLTPFQGGPLRASVAIARSIYRPCVGKGKQARFHALEIRSAEHVLVSVRETDKQVMHFRYSVACRRVSAEKF